jgi:hypothetical protein
MSVKKVTAIPKVVPARNDSIVALFHATLFFFTTWSTISVILFSISLSIYIPFIFFTQVERLRLASADPLLRQELQPLLLAVLCCRKKHAELLQELPLLLSLSL